MLKKTIRSVVVGLVGLIAVLYLTGNGFVFQLVAKVLETGRTTAGIDDYLYFDNAEIPPRDNPQAWPCTKILIAPQANHPSIVFTKSSRPWPF